MVADGGKSIVYVHLQRLTVSVRFFPRAGKSILLLTLKSLFIHILMKAIVAFVCYFYLVNLKPLINSPCQGYSHSDFKLGSHSIHFHSRALRGTLLYLRGGDDQIESSANLEGSQILNQNLTSRASAAATFTQIAKMTTEQLYAERTRIERSMDSVLVQLEALGMPQPPPGAFNHQPLLDDEGFPRADIDIPAVLSLRGRLISLRAERREVELRLEQAMEAYFASDQLDAEAGAGGSETADGPMRIRGGGARGRVEPSDSSMTDSDGPAAPEFRRPSPPLLFHGSAAPSPHPSPPRPLGPSPGAPPPPSGPPVPDAARPSQMRSAGARTGRRRRRRRMWAR